MIYQSKIRKQGEINEPKMGSMSKTRGKNT